MVKKSYPCAAFALRFNYCCFDAALAGSGLSLQRRSIDDWSSISQTGVYQVFLYLNLASSFRSAFFCLEVQSPPEHSFSERLKMV
jgi:hypothetical protein